MLQHCTEYMLWVNENLKSCRNKNKKEYVVALTGYCSVAHVRPGVRLIRFRTLFVNKSYRRYAVCRTTSVVTYVRQTIVNSHPVPRPSNMTVRLQRVSRFILNTFISQTMSYNSRCNYDGFPYILFYYLVLYCFITQSVIMYVTGRCTVRCKSVIIV